MSHFDSFDAVSRPQMHLLSTVFLSPIALQGQRYDTSKLRLDEDELARIGRYLTGLKTLAALPWASAQFHFSLDEVWKKYEADLTLQVEQLFPGCRVSNARFCHPADWHGAVLGMPEDSLLYIHANDDHALVAETHSFMEEARRLSRDPDAMLSMVTHFPEVKGMLYRQKPFRSLREDDSIMVNYALGTSLVKVGFYKSWWAPEKISPQEKIVRPDNPVGQSITFPPTKCLVPRTELIRHMDGYDHILLQRPLGPLRNTCSLGAASARGSHNQPAFTPGLWPDKVLGLHGKGPDFHSLEITDGWFRNVRIGIARINAQWALRVHFGDLSNARNYPSRLPIGVFCFSAALATLIPRNFLNVIDLAIDALVISPMFFAARKAPDRFRWVSKVYYLGARRAILLRMRAISAIAK